ncbi:hypothetical protein F5Y08DRAFT_352808 [Xylaria arbuscula]|nr:hypothetical protein F5Y08DRAFT_352808 [Xylaria arbuscula]
MVRPSSESIWHKNALRHKNTLRHKIDRGDSPWAIFNYALENNLFNALWGYMKNSGVQELERFISVDERYTCWIVAVSGPSIRSASGDLSDENDLQLNYMATRIAAYTMFLQARISPRKELPPNNVDAARHDITKGSWSSNWDQHWENFLDSVFLSLKKLFAVVASVTIQRADPISVVDNANTEERDHANQTAPILYIAGIDSAWYHALDASQKEKVKKLVQSLDGSFYGKAKIAFIIDCFFWTYEVDPRAEPPKIYL